MSHFVRTMLFLNEVEIEKNISGGNVKILLIFLYLIDLQCVVILIKIQCCAVFWLLFGVIVALIFYWLDRFEKHRQR